jgi:iron complex outermembrane receptor protein
VKKNAKRGPVSRAVVLTFGSALAATGQSAAAQGSGDAGEAITLNRIEVTGSHIPRSDAESALPVQIITRKEIERSGSTTVAELMSKVSANILGFNDQLSIGQQIGVERGTPGLSSVNLRGIGDGSTLYLSMAGGLRTTRWTRRPLM